ncbi:MAG: hydantoinase/oxoprolinase family protein [Pseudomonadota bacterium]
MRLGIDVGGTHTDAVLMDDGVLLAKKKALTSADITSGVIGAARAVLDLADVAALDIRMLTVGTTQFTNAVVERRRLTPVGVLRIGAQSSRALPIAAKWPDDLRAQTIGLTRMIDGGHNYDGTEIVPLDRTALAAAIGDFRGAGLQAIAVTSVFAPYTDVHETAAVAAIREGLPAARIAVSSRLGRLGLYQRENATILNASLLPFADQVVDAFREAFASLDIRCPLLISQNDGTLMKADHAKTFPVMTFSSGPTNSMRGAAWLSQVDTAMVVDVGGTTSDIGMLLDAFPRQSGTAVKIGGVLTNFRMPDVLALGLGGGSVVAGEGAQVGPQSVGHDLVQEAHVFGGNQLTATDIGVAAGRANIGATDRLKALDPRLVSRAQATMKSMLARALDQMKTSQDDLPLIVVGGGGFLVPDDLPGVSQIIRPADGDVANAIGAAYAQVSGEGEALFQRSGTRREDALASATQTARRRALAAGAAHNSLNVADITETPLTYTDDPGATITVKVIGDVDLDRQQVSEAPPC